MHRDVERLRGLVPAQRLALDHQVVRARRQGRGDARCAGRVVLAGGQNRERLVREGYAALRKPEQQLVEFMKNSKVQLRKYMYTIKATETALNGRINADVMLLKTA